MTNPQAQYNIRKLFVAFIFGGATNSYAFDVFSGNESSFNLAEEFSKVANKVVQIADDTIQTVNNKTEYVFTLTNLTRYDSNPLFFKDGSGVLQNTTKGLLGTHSYFDNAEIHFKGGLTVIRSSKPDIIFNQEFPELTGGVLKSWEKSSVDLSATYNQTSARRYELAETGLIFKDNVRVYKSVVAKYSTQFDSSLGLDVTMTRSYTDYQIKAAGLIPYDLFTTSLGFNKLLSDKWILLTNLAYTSYNPQGGSIKYTLLNAGFSYSPIENEQLTVLYGQTYSTIDSSATGSNYSLKYSHKEDTYDYAVDYAQSTNPSPLGTLLLNKSVSFLLNKEINDTSRGYLRVSRAINTNSTVLVNENVSRNFEIGFNKKINEDFNLGLNCGVQQIERDFTATSNYIGLTLTYNYKR